MHTGEWIAAICGLIVIIGMVVAGFKGWFNREQKIEQSEEGLKTLAETNKKLQLLHERTLQTEVALVSLAKTSEMTLVRLGEIAASTKEMTVKVDLIWGLVKQNISKVFRDEKE